MFINKTALFPAILIDCLNSMQYFLQNNVSVNAVLDENKISLLMVASYNGYFEIVEELLKQKADPDLKNITGNTALMLASGVGHDNIVDILLKYEADPNIQRDNDEPGCRNF